jgi:CspA family cold shock protein
LTGTVRWFDEGKGFGLILGDDGADYRVGTCEIVNAGYRFLADEDPVTFQDGLGADGRPKAVNVNSLPRTRVTVKSSDVRGCRLKAPADGGDDVCFHSVLCDGDRRSRATASCETSRVSPARAT